MLNFNRFSEQKSERDSVDPLLDALEAASERIAIDKGVADGDVQSEKLSLSFGSEAVEEDSGDGERLGISGRGRMSDALDGENRDGGEVDDVWLFAHGIAIELGIVGKILCLFDGLADFLDEFFEILLHRTTGIDIDSVVSHHGEGRMDRFVGIDFSLDDAELHLGNRIDSLHDEVKEGFEKGDTLFLCETDDVCDVHPDIESVGGVGKGAEPAELVALWIIGQIDLSSLIHGYFLSF